MINFYRGKKIIPFWPDLYLSWKFQQQNICMLSWRWGEMHLQAIYISRWVKIPESFPTSIRGFSGSNDEDILWNFPNWFIRNLRNGVLFYRQLQADCLYHINCLYNFPAYTWRQKRNAFPGLCNGSIFMIQKNLIIISGTEPRFLCWEIKLIVSYIDNSS